MRRPLPTEPLVSVETARERVLARFAALETMRVPIGDAIGHVVASDIEAPEPLPRFDNSAMDGFAVRAEDVRDASEDSAAQLAVVGEVRAGSSEEPRVTAGTAVRIMTGAPVPPGANAVIPIEDVELRADTVIVTTPARPGAHVRPAGDDVDAGRTLVRAGMEIGGGEAALLASLGVSPLDVHRSPRVALLVTGDELVPPEGTPGRGQIRDSNSISLVTLAREAGAEVELGERVPDTLAEHRESFSRAAEGTDLILSSGGVAVGDYDYVKDVVEELGSIDLWRVAMQPGKPVVLGTVKGVPFLGLPGNPVSVHVSFEQFVRPAIRKMRGCRSLLRPTIRARLTESIEKRPGRLHFVRVRLATDDRGFLATPTGKQGSHIQSSLIDCHGVALFDRDAARIEKGEDVTVEVWDLPLDR